MARRLLSLCFCLALAAPALAGPCADDIAKSCAKESRKEKGVTACLERHQEQLSSSCRAALDHFIAAKSQTVSLCRNDFKEFCPGAKHGDAGADACLWEHRKVLSDDCRGALEQIHAWSFTSRQKRFEKLERRKPKPAPGKP